MNSKCPDQVSTWFLVNLALGSPLIVVVFMANGVLFYALTRNRFLPGNVRVLLINLTVGVLLMNVDAVWKFIEGWSTVLYGYQHQDDKFCKLREWCYLIPGSLFCFSMLGLAIERWISTRQLLRYKIPADRVHPFIIAVVIGIWLAVMVADAIYIYVIPEDLDKVLEYRNSTEQIGSACWCQTMGRAMTNLAVNIPCLWIYVLQELSGLGIFFVVWRQNCTGLTSFNLHTERHSLQQRFQIKQNIYITEMLIPALLIHAIAFCIVNFTYMICTCFPRIYDVRYDVVRGSAIGLFVYSPMLVYNIVSPIVIINRSDHLKTTLLQLSKTELDQQGEENVALQNIVKRNSGAETTQCLPTQVRSKLSVHDFHLQPEQSMDILANIWGAAKPNRI